MIGQRDLSVIFHSSMILRPITIVQQSIIMVCTGVTWILIEKPGETASWTLARGVCTFHTVTRMGFYNKD